MEQTGEPDSTFAVPSAPDRRTDLVVGCQAALTRDRDGLLEVGVRFLRGQIEQGPGRRREG